MQQLEQILTFILDHKELITTLLVTLLTIIKLTSWGLAQPYPYPPNTSRAAMFNPARP